MRDEAKSVLGRLCASLCALALCTAFHFADQNRIVGLFGGPVVLACLAVTLAALPWLPETRRAPAVMGLSLAVIVWVLRGLVVVPLAFTWLALRTVQQPWTKARKLGLLLGAWLAVTVLGWFVMQHLPRYVALAVYWGSLPAALIWLTLDHGRGKLDGLSTLEKWLYLLVFPRFCAPFIHPIGAARLLKSWRAAPSPWLSLRALALGLYGIAMFYVIGHTHFSAKSSVEDFSLIEHGPRVFKNAVHIYAYNCSSIFIAVSLLRLAGYDLGSGFNWPTLSATPSEFFRRWNYYFFDFANIAIFTPIASRLRRFVPLWLAYVVGAYASFALGVWVLDIVSRFPQSYLGLATYASLTNFVDLRNHFTMWTMVIVAQILIMPGRRLQHHWWWRALTRAGSWGMVIGGLIWLFVTKNRLY